MKLFIIGLIVSCSLYSIVADETRLIELEPDEAAQIINKQDQSLRYAPKIESNVPGVRFINDHPEHVVEDIYLANQYHGQDGLGAYVYGYSIPDIAKTEKKERSGDLKGAYNYIAGNGQEIKVQYWDDGTGFHQIDNVPKILPKQIDDLPEVAAAKEEHLRLWHEQAERNSHAPVDPNASAGQYDNEGQYNDDEGQYNEESQPQPIQAQYQQYQQGPQPYASQNQGVTHYQASAGQPLPYQAAQFQAQQPGALYHQAHGQAQGVSGQAQVSPNSVEYSGQYSHNQQAYAQGPGKAAGGAGVGAGVGGGALTGAGAGSAHGAGVGHAAAGGQHAAAEGKSVTQGAYGAASGQHTVGGQAWAQGSDASASQHSSSQQAWAQGSGAGKLGHQQEEEETGPPKGFFYSFDYPVGLIVGREGKNLELFYSQNKNLYEQQLKGEAPRPSSAASAYHAAA